MARAASGRPRRSCRSPPTQRDLVMMGRPSRRGFAASLALAVCAATTRPAQAARSATPAPAMPATLLDGMQYRLVGHSIGGRVTTVTGVPSQPRTFYMGVASGGLFRTTDGGESWQPISDGQIPVGSMGDIAVADSDPNVIYVGTGSDGVRSNVSTGRGVYRSRPTAARRWTLRRPLRRRPDRRACASTRPTRTSRGSPRSATPSSATPSAASSRRTDGGKTWKKTLYVTDSTGAWTSKFSPAIRTCVYAWMCAHRAQAVDDHQRLARGRHLQEHRRRQHLDEARRPACRTNSSARATSP